MAPLSSCLRTVVIADNNANFTYMDVDLSSCTPGNLLILIVNQNHITATGPAWTTVFTFDEASPGYSQFATGYIDIRIRTVGASEGTISVGDAYPFHGFAIFEATVHPGVKEAGGTGFLGVADTHGRFDVGNTYGDEGFVTTDVPIDAGSAFPATLRIEVASYPAVNGDTWDTRSGWTQYDPFGGSAIGPPRGVRVFATSTDGNGGPGGVWPGVTWLEPENTMGFIGPIHAAGVCIASLGGGWQVNRMRIG